MESRRIWRLNLPEWRWLTRPLAGAVSVTVTRVARNQQDRMLVAIGKRAVGGNLSAVIDIKRK